MFTAAQAVKESANRGRRFLTTLESDVAPAIKELRATLQARRPGTVPPDFTDCLKRFEIAVQGVRDVHAQLQTSIEKVRRLRERLKKP